MEQSEGNIRLGSIHCPAWFELRGIFEHPTEGALVVKMEYPPAWREVAVLYKCNSRPTPEVINARNMVLRSRGSVFYQTFVYLDKGEQEKAFDEFMHLVAATFEERLVNIQGYEYNHNRINRIRKNLKATESIEWQIRWALVLFWEPIFEPLNTTTEMVKAMEATLGIDAGLANHNRHNITRTLKRTGLRREFGHKKRGL